MAKFLDTAGVSYHLGQLLKGTEEKLFLISPYLQFSGRIKEYLKNLNLLKRDIRIIYRENKLQVAETDWLESQQPGIRTSICENLHAKCYLNEKEAIITSMNLYQFSQENNNEMGIYFTKAEDPDLYKETYDEVQRLLQISQEIVISVKKITEEKQSPQKVEEKPLAANTTSFKPLGKWLSTSALSKEMKISSKDLFAKFESLGFIQKEFNEWELTQLGEQMGGQIKKGQYGDYIAWPENIVTMIK